MNVKAKNHLHLFIIVMAYNCWKAPRLETVIKATMTQAFSHRRR